ncbi:MAG: mycothiol system anti-sigma-R factor [Acidimicrobiales bacterium]
MTELGPILPIGDCGDAVHRLYHFLDGELDDSRRSDIERHLDACHDCLGAFDFELDLRQTIARKCRDRVPDALRARIAVALQHEFKAWKGGPGTDPLRDGMSGLQ